MSGISGLTEVTARLRAMAAAVDAATPTVLETGMELFEGKARANLSRYSHRRGTPTPSPPGEPPAKISGDLRDSFEHTEPVSVGPGVWTAAIGPNIVYSRIHELGGLAGRGHRSKIPKRPYLKPAIKSLAADPVSRQMVARTWGAALRA